MKHIFLILISVLLLSGCGSAPAQQKPAVEAKESIKCKSDQECQAIDCSVYDSPAKSGYSPECVNKICKCMCRDCE
ncbi:MAG: hypothetical protein WC258_01960 [Patescibacteria group bacterium]|jgi:PBP1b-binding outer membrane lipoprotein LpoB